MRSQNNLSRIRSPRQISAGGRILKNFQQTRRPAAADGAHPDNTAPRSTCQIPATVFIIVVQKRAVPGAVQPQGALAQLRRPLPQTIQHHAARAMTRDGAREIVDVPRALRRKIRPARILVQQHRRGGDLAALLQHVQPSGLQLLSKIRPRIRLQITIIVPLPQPDPIHPRNALQNQPVRRVQLPRLRSAKNRLPTIHSCTPSLPSSRQTRSSRAFRLSAPPIPHILRAFHAADASVSRLHPVPAVCTSPSGMLRRPRLHFRANALERLRRTARNIPYVPHLRSRTESPVDPSRTCRSSPPHAHSRKERPAPPGKALRFPVLSPPSLSR